MKGKYLNGVRLIKPVEKSSYLYDLPVVRFLEEREKVSFSKDVTFFVGENGTGKSTLLEAIAVADGFNAEGGSRNYHFSTEDSHSELYRHIALSKTSHPKNGFFLRAESFYNAASYIKASAAPALSEAADAF